MILVNMPLAIGWLMIYQGDAIWKIFTGCALHGLGMGLMEGPLVTYLGEICEPSTRGVLVSLTYITGTSGMFLGLFLNTIMPWRFIAAVCLACPIITAIAICFIPETPQWLLFKNRTAEAEKSLRWLRGWVSSSSRSVAQEFHELQKHNEQSKSCNTCIKRDLKCTHPLPTLSEKFAELKRKRTLKPLSITIFMFCVSGFSGFYSMRPFIVQIFEAYESPLPPDRAAVMLSLIESLTCGLFTCLIRFTGKRRLYLVAALGAFLSAGAISCYGFIYLPSGYISFDLTHGPFHVENTGLRYIPTICLTLSSFFSFCGIISMPWILSSEIFPMKSRGVASGVTIALNYSLRFIAKKSYYSMETTLSLPGISLFFCVVYGIAFVVTYFILPETENISLDDIERHFSDNSKKITDRKIRKSNMKTPSKDVEGSVKITETSFENVANNSYGINNKRY
ncbi:facilitated trehalose transporter Tret1-like [Sitodiplosis mosellana]|uniref:facilitated trehalose transporter Tret1-like n=1 Tax=Sitodiplosis mosellana TaxID=263140 RepID=UPI002444AD77|nr:facilitated trehalose transporter Tret1-like [Sitodiplosis mosellana]